MRVGACCLVAWGLYSVLDAYPAHPARRDGSRALGGASTTSAPTARVGIGSTGWGQLPASLPHRLATPPTYQGIVPPHLSSIPAPGNALGDLNADGVADLIDLLRLRDLANRSGTKADSIEALEADMNGDGRLDSSDVSYLRDVLLAKRALPFLIGPQGGDVVGNRGRTTFTIPAGAFPSAKRLSVEDYPLDSLQADLGTPASTWGGAQVFMAGAKLTLLNPGSEDSILPAGVQLKELVPPGMTIDTTTHSGVYALSPDGDGDGIPDIQRLGDLTFLQTSSATSGAKEGAPRVASSVAAAVFQLSNTPAQITGTYHVVLDSLTGTFMQSPTAQYESGMPIAITGHDWPSVFAADYVVGYVASGDTILQQAGALIPPSPSSYEQVTAALWSAPAVDTVTNAVVFVGDVLTGRASNAIPITIRPATRSPDSLGAALKESYALIDSALAATSAGGAAAESLVSSWRRLEMVVDSVVAGGTIDTTGARRFVAMVENLQVREMLAWERRRRGVSGVHVSSSAECEQCKQDELKLYSLLALCAASTGAQAAACHTACISCQTCVVAGRCRREQCTIPCVDCPRLLECLCIPIKCALSAAQSDCDLKCCPSKSSRSDKADRHNNGGDWKVFCLHPGCDKLGGNVGCPSMEGCPLSGSEITRSRAALVRERRVATGVGASESIGVDLGGIVVTVKHSPIPVSMDVTDRSGRFLIPFNVLSGPVTLSAYDPRTGFYVDSLATVMVGDPYNEIHGAFGLSFSPDSTTAVIPLPLGSYRADAVPPRKEYRVPVGSASAGQRMNVGLRGFQPLTVWVREPGGKFVYRDSSTACARVVIPAASAGVYQVVVGYGVSGGQGPFAVGANIGHGNAVPFLCGALEDTLFADIFPQYIVDVTASVSPLDRVLIEAGTVVEFRNGGTLTADGTLSGSATPGAAIRLRGASGGGAGAAGLVTGQRMLRAGVPESAAVSRRGHHLPR